MYQCYESFSAIAWNKKSVKHNINVSWDGRFKVKNIVAIVQLVNYVCKVSGKPRFRR